MPRRRSVTQLEIERAIKGAVAAGFTVGRVEVNPNLGTIVIVGPTEEGRYDPALVNAEHFQGKAAPNDFDE